MGKSGKLFKALVSGVKAFKSPSKEKSEKEKSASKADKDNLRKGSKDKCLWSLGKSSSRNRDSLAAAAAFLDAPEIKSVQVENLHVKDGPPTAHLCLTKPGCGHKAPTKAEDEFHSGRGLPMNHMEEIEQEELAAIKIQAAIRRYLVLHRVSRALRALVRLQALARGRQVRKQASTALRCMQALVKVQALARGHRVRSSELGQLIQKHLQQTRLQRKKPAEGWVSSMGTLQQLQAKAQSKQDAVMKRQRALVYAFSEQLNRCTPKQNSSLAIDYQRDKGDWGWVWLERWMAARPWGSPPVVAKEEHIKINTEKIIKVDPEVYTGVSEKEILPLMECVTPNKETTPFSEFVDDIISHAQRSPSTKEKEATYHVVGMEEEQVEIFSDVEMARKEDKPTSEISVIGNASVNTEVVQTRLPSPPVPPPPPPPPAPPHLVNMKVLQRPLPSPSPPPPPPPPSPPTRLVTMKAVQRPLPSPPPPPPPPPPPHASRAKPLVAHQKGSVKGQKTTIASSTYCKPLVAFEALHLSSSEGAAEQLVETFSSTLTTTKLRSSCAKEPVLPDFPSSPTLDPTSVPSVNQPIEAFTSPSTPKSYPEPLLHSIQSTPTIYSITPENGGISQAQCDKMNVSMPMPSMSDLPLESLSPSQFSSPPAVSFQVLPLPPQDCVIAFHELHIADITVEEFSRGVHTPEGNGSGIFDNSMTSVEEPIQGLDGEAAMNIQDRVCMDSKTDKANQGEVDMEIEELGSIDFTTEEAIQAELLAEMNRGCDTSIVPNGEKHAEVCSNKPTTCPISRQGQLTESVSPSIPNYMSTTKSSKAKVRSLTSPMQKSDSPKQKMDSPKPRFDSSRQKMDSPKQNLDSPKQKLDSPKQKSDSAIKRRHSLSAMEGKGSPGTQKAMHVRASSKGQLASLRDTSTENLTRVNGDLRRHGK